MKEESLLKIFKEYNLQYTIHQHEPVFTVDESQHLTESIPGAHSKNLFLKDKKKSLFLVSVLEQKRLHLKALSKILGKGGLSFAGAEDMLEKLNLTPGSVTPYGLIHDQNKEVTFVLDRDFLNYEIVNFHPLRNDQTLSVNINDFLAFFEKLNHRPQLIEIPEI